MLVLANAKTATYYLQALEKNEILKEQTGTENLYRQYHIFNTQGKDS
jgi:hypothetical protein